MLISYHINLADQYCVNLQQLGLTLSVAPDIIDTIDTIAAAGKPSGIFAVNPADAKHYLARGVNFVAIASDINSMATSLRQTVSRFRP